MSDLRELTGEESLGAWRAERLSTDDMGEWVVYDDLNNPILITDFAAVARFVCVLANCRDELCKLVENAHWLAGTIRNGGPDDSDLDALIVEDFVEAEAALQSKLDSLKEQSDE